MSWNHRILAHEDGNDIFYQVHEVYYDNKGIPNGYGGVVMGGNQLSEILWQTSMIKEALNKPILSVKDFPNEHIIKIKKDE